jgi:acetyltransferase-like isoleucine patch superfamily enzyme
MSKLALYLPGGRRVRPFLHRIRGVKVGRNVWISQHVYIDELHPETVFIGHNTSIGLRTSIINHFYWGPRRKDNHSKVIIEDDVFIGPHCVILPNVRIGAGSIIQAGTVVHRNVPPRTFWGPQPAGPLARATVPLTPDHEFEAFVAGLRPVRQPRKKETKS